MRYLPPTIAPTPQSWSQLRKIAIAAVVLVVLFRFGFRWAQQDTAARQAAKESSGQAEAMAE